MATVEYLNKPELFQASTSRFKEAEDVELNRRETLAGTNEGNDGRSHFFLICVSRNSFSSENPWQLLSGGRVIFSLSNILFSDL